MPRFAANLSMMFNEVPFLDRFKAAAAAGFSAVEFLFPYEYSPEEVTATAKAAGTQPVAKADPPARPTGNAAERTAKPSKVSSALPPTAIRNVSVRRGPDSLDVIIEGPSTAEPYLLKHPDRLVLDFTGARLAQHPAAGCLLRRQARHQRFYRVTALRAPARQVQRPHHRRADARREHPAVLLGEV